MEKFNRGNLAPYTERSSVNVSEDVETILSDPEVHLTTEEKKLAKEFAHGLFAGRIGDAQCTSSRGLEQLNITSVLTNVQTYYLDYFDTPEGLDELDSIGININSENPISEILNDIDYIKSITSSKQRKQLAIKSKDWRKTIISKRLLDDPENDVNFDDIEKLVVNFEPDKFLDKLSDLQAYRKFYKQIRKKLEQDSPSNLDLAKLVLLDIHQAKVNSMINELYPSAMSLGKQVMGTANSPKNRERQIRLGVILPLLVNSLNRHTDYHSKEYSNHENRFARLLDFMRNGADWQNGALTPISQELTDLADSLETNEDQITSVDQAKLLSAEIVKKLDEIDWNAEQLKDFCGSVLAEWQLLSNYSADWDEIEERDGPAADGKWQVAIKPSSKNLSVSKGKKVLWIPKDFLRTLTQESPAGGLPVATHELTHLLQSEYDDQLARQLPIAKIGGRRLSTVKEAGTIYQERKIQNTFRRDRQSNLHYLRALKVKLQGGNQLQVSRAFYNSYIEGKILNENELDKARSLAVDRSLRLFAKKGHSSKSLSYLEQDLIIKQLSNISNELIELLTIAYSSFSLPDLAKLHKVGLIELSDKKVINISSDVLRVFERDYLPGYISAN